jgi:hypothetical protein
MHVPMRHIALLMFAGITAASCHIAVGLNQFELVDEDDGSAGGAATNASSSSLGGMGGGGGIGGAGGSSSTGPTGCDTEVGGTQGSVVCSDCIACTQTSECQMEWEACAVAGSPCDDFVLCLQGCDMQCMGNPACLDMCFGNLTCDPATEVPGSCGELQSAGCMEYLNAYGCSICVGCPIDCDGASACGGM